MFTDLGVVRTTYDAVVGSIDSFEWSINRKYDIISEMFEAIKPVELVAAASSGPSCAKIPTT